MNWIIDVITGLIPGRCQGASLISIQIFDSSLNVTPALQSAEAES